MSKTSSNRGGKQECGWCVLIKDVDPTAGCLAASCHGHLVRDLLGQHEDMHGDVFQCPAALSRNVWTVQRPAISALGCVAPSCDASFAIVL